MRVSESDRATRNGHGGKVGGRIDGGWIPVLRNHRASPGNRTKSKEIFTLFVDNIPEVKDQQWLQSTFNKFGVVKDAFIPWKRSKRTRNRFGFVRYECHVSAGMAVSRMNGVWVEDKRLFVKEACFGRMAERKMQQVPRFHVSTVSLNNRACSNPESGAGKSLKDGPSPVWDRKGQGASYAQVLNGETSNPVKAEEQSITLHIHPEGNGWLYRSAVATMNRVVSMMTLKVSFSLETDMVAQFRALGGRSVLITFQS